MLKRGVRDLSKFVLYCMQGRAPGLPMWPALLSLVTGTGLVACCVVATCDSLTTSERLGVTPSPFSLVSKGL